MLKGGAFRKMTRTFDTASERFKWLEHEAGGCPDKCDFCEEEKREMAEARRGDYGSEKE